MKLLRRNYGLLKVWIVIGWMVGSLSAAVPSEDLASSAQVRVLSLDNEKFEGSSIEWRSEGGGARLKSLEFRWDDLKRIGGLLIVFGEGLDVPEGIEIERLEDGKWVEIPSAQVFKNEAKRLEIPFDEKVETAALKLKIESAQGGIEITDISIWKYGESADTLFPYWGKVDDERSIFVNQSGYNLNAPKRFTAIGFPEKVGYQILKAEGGEVLYGGMVENQIGDFSEFKPTSEDEYVIRIEGEDSDRFRIGPWWIERVTYQLAMDFMIASRNYVGNVKVPARKSYAWRDDHHFAFILRTLVDQYLSNPEAYKRMPRKIEYEKSEGDAWGELVPYDEDAPDIIKMIHWGADIVVTEGITHELMKGDLAYFLYAWPWMKEWLDPQNYERVKDFALEHWSDQEADAEYPYDESPKNGHDLLELKTIIGTTKGAYPLGFSIMPNLLMAEVLERESDERAQRFRRAAQMQVEWIVEHIDVWDPQVSKGQRMSENLLMMSLGLFNRLNPEGVSSGMREFVNEWVEVVIKRSENLWDFRKLTDEGAWAPFIEGVPTAWNEPGNVMGLPAAVFEASQMIEDPAKRERLTEIGYAALDHMFGRNPVGRHFSYDGAREIEGVERGWYSFYPGGIGQLAEVPFVMDGSPKAAHYPYHPEIGNIGWTEGWVSFNAAYNRTLAVMAYVSTELSLAIEDGYMVARLKAPLNFDYGKDERIAINVTTSRGDREEAIVVELEPLSMEMKGRVPLRRGSKVKVNDGVLNVYPGDKVWVSYGYGYYEHRAASVVSD